MTASPAAPSSAKWIDRPERERFPRPLHPGLGPHRRPDAVRHLPRVHRGRAHHRRHPRAERVGTGGARRTVAPIATSGLVGGHALPPGTLFRDAAARHRQGAGRRPFGAGGRACRCRSARPSGSPAEETETVSWLVLHHLLLSQTAFKRDIDDPKTIMDLADTIQSPERLKLLLVLTVADMRAVSAKVVERLEGDPAAGAVFPGGGRARRRARHHGAGRAGGAGEGRRRGGASRRTGRRPDRSLLPGHSATLVTG